MLRTAISIAIVMALGACATATKPELLKADGLRGKLKFEVVNGEYFVDRYTYPTGNFDAKWILAAEKQYQSVATGIPSGALFEAGRSAQMRLTPGQFSFLGPKPMSSTGGGTGVGSVAGRVNSISAHPNNANEVLIATDGGGIWKTTTCCTVDTVWRPVTDSPLINSIAISDIARDPNDPNTIYAGTGDFRFGSFMFGAWGVLKSTNGGETWDALGTSSFTPFFPPSANGFPQYQAVSAVRVDPNNSNRVVAGTKTGIFMSYDAGQNWTGP